MIAPTGMMDYKGYLGQVVFDAEAGIFHGEVINTRDVITFQGTSVTELRDALRDSVEDYLAFCKERGEQPEKPYSGRFVARIPPTLHQRISIAAKLEGKSLNSWVRDQLKRGVAKRRFKLHRAGHGRGKMTGKASTKGGGKGGK